MLPIFLFVFEGDNGSTGSQDACSKGQHIDIVVPMTHQLIDDDRLLAVTWWEGPRGKGLS